jgi:hypothetical protein
VVEWMEKVSDCRYFFFGTRGCNWSTIRPRVDRLAALRELSAISHEVPILRQLQTPGFGGGARHDGLLRGMGLGFSKDETHKVYDAFREPVGNFIDTANPYTNGMSQSCPGEFMKDNRQSLVRRDPARCGTRTGYSRKQIAYTP